MEIMIPKQIQQEKVESDLLWSQIFEQALQGKLNVNTILWAIIRCNEVDKAILKIKM